MSNDVYVDENDKNQNVENNPKEDETVVYRPLGFLREGMDCIDILSRL